MTAADDPFATRVPPTRGLGLFRRRTSAVEGELIGLLGVGLLMERVGSRVTCSPPPTGTDEDWLVCTFGDPAPALAAAGFSQDGSPEFYTGSDAGGFRSWRRGELNVITTPDRRFFELFMTATALAKRFNLLDKGDRIALFQAVLYGVRVDNLESPTDRPGDDAGPIPIARSVQP